MSRKYQHRKDNNHDAVVAALKREGWHVIDTSQTGLGFDLLCGKAGRLVPVEVKDPASSRGLTLSEREAKAHAALRAQGIHVEIVTGDDDSLEPLREPRREYYR